MLTTNQSLYLSGKITIDAFNITKSSTFCILHRLPIIDYIDKISNEGGKAICLLFSSNNNDNKSIIISGNLTAITSSSNSNNSHPNTLRGTTIPITSCLVMLQLIKPLLSIPIRWFHFHCCALLSFLSNVHCFSLYDRIYSFLICSFACLLDFISLFVMFIFLELIHKI